MSSTCEKCEYRDKCKGFGFQMDVEDQDECEHYYGFSEEEDEE